MPPGNITDQRSSIAVLAKSAGLSVPSPLMLVLAPKDNIARGARD